MNLITLVVLIITLTCLDKNIVHPGQGTYEKGIDTLLAWLINAVNEFPNPDPR